MATKQELNVRWRFEREAPRIGCGERGVNIKIDNRVARFTEFASGAKARMPRSVFEKLKHRIVDPDFVPRRAFDSRRRRAKSAAKQRRARRKQ